MILWTIACLIYVNCHYPKTHKASFWGTKSKPFTIYGLVSSLCADECCIQRSNSFHCDLYVYPASPRIKISKFSNWLYILTNPWLKLGGKKNIFIRINMDPVKTEFIGRR